MKKYDKKCKGLRKLDTPHLLDWWLTSLRNRLVAMAVDFRQIDEAQTKQLLAATLNYDDWDQCEKHLDQGEPASRPTSISTSSGMVLMITRLQSLVIDADVDVFEVSLSQSLHLLAKALEFDSWDQCFEEWRKAEFVRHFVQNYGVSEAYADARYLACRRTSVTTAEQMINSCMQRGC